MEKIRTVISRQSADGGIEVLRNDLSGSLRTQAGTVTIVVHERNLLGGLVRGVEIILSALRYQYWVSGL
jgi:hypothetical protein